MPCGANEGLSEPFVTEIMDTLAVDGWNGRRRAAMMLEALRAHYEFYGRYGGFLDVLEAIALFANRGPRPDTMGTNMTAKRALTEAGWTWHRIGMVCDGLAALPGDDQSYNGLEGDCRHIRGGLMVIRDVWLVPQFLPETRAYAEEMFLRELERDLKCKDDTRADVQAQAWQVRQEFYAMILGKLQRGEWRSLGWSCAYDTVLGDEEHEQELVRAMIRKDERGVAPSMRLPRDPVVTVRTDIVDPRFGIVVNPDGKDIDQHMSVPVDNGGKEPV